MDPTKIWVVDRASGHPPGSFQVIDGDEATKLVARGYVQLAAHISARDVMEPRMEEVAVDNIDIAEPSKELPLAEKQYHNKYGRKGR